MGQRIKLATAVLFLFFSISLVLGAEEESFSFKSDSSRIILPQGKKQIILTGNAMVESETLNIKADEIRRYGNDLQFTLCIGNVIAVDLDREIEIVCDELVFDTDNDTITINSYSEMRDKKNDVVSRSGYLFDKRKEKITLLSINVRIFKEDTICRAEFARMDHNTKMLELTGSPAIYMDGNELSSSKIVYNIENEEITFVGDVAGTVNADKDE